jgi:hypothetical protein
VTTGYFDIVFVLGVAMVMLTTLDWRITKAFRNHERREEQLHAGTQLVSDAAAATAREASRMVAEIRLEVAAQKINVANLSELLRDQEGRLASVELRLTRAAIAVPHQQRKEGSG